MAEHKGFFGELFDTCTVISLLIAVQYAASLIVGNLKVSGKDYNNLCTDASYSSVYPDSYYKNSTDTTLKTGVLEFTSPDNLLDVTLIGMIHYAEPEFYNNVESIISGTDKLLLEDVKFEADDKTAPIYLFLHKVTSAQNKISWGSLISQQELYESLADDYKGEIILADQTMDEIISRYNRPFDRWYFLNLTMFVDTSLKFLDLHEGPILDFEGEKGLENFIEVSNPLKDVSYEDLSLICSRNETLMSNFDAVYEEAKQSGRHTRVAIPWGIDHLPDIVRRLTEEGFSLSSHYYLDVVDISEQ